MVVRNALKNETLAAECALSSLRRIPKSGDAPSPHPWSHRFRACQLICEKTQKKEGPRRLSEQHSPRTLGSFGPLWLSRLSARRRCILKPTRASMSLPRNARERDFQTLWKPSSNGVSADRSRTALVALRRKTHRRLSWRERVRASDALGQISSTVGSRALGSANFMSSHLSLTTVGSVYHPLGACPAARLLHRIWTKESPRERSRPNRQVAPQTSKSHWGDSRWPESELGCEVPLRRSLDIASANISPEIAQKGCGDGMRH